MSDCADINTVKIVFMPSFPFIPITGILVLLLDMGHIWPFWPYMAHIAMTNGFIDMPVMGIQGESA